MPVQPSLLLRRIARDVLSFGGQPSPVSINVLFKIYVNPLKKWPASRSLGEGWCARQDLNLRPTD